MECKGAIANARAPKGSKIFDHFFRCCGSTPSHSAVKSTAANSSWFAPTMCGRSHITMCGESHIGSNLRQRYSRVGAINNKRSTQCQLLILYTCATIRGGAKDISTDDACKVRSAPDGMELGGTRSRVQWGTRCLGHRGAASIHIHRAVANTKGKRKKGGGQNQKWPTSGQGGYITPATCHLGGPHRFRAGGRIRSGSIQKWKILFFGGHAIKRGFQSGGTTSEIAHKWAQWQPEVAKLIFLGK